MKGGHTLPAAVAAALMLMMLLLPAAAVAADAGGADGEDADYLMPRDQLSGNAAAVYDALASFTAERLTATAELVNPMYTAAGADGEAYLEAEASALVAAAYQALSAGDPLAICTWGSGRAVLDIDAQTLVRTGGLVGLERLVLEAEIDPVYADDPATGDVDELRERIDALEAAIGGFGTSSSARGAVGDISGHLGSLKVSGDGGGYADDAYGALVESGTVSPLGIARGFQALAQAQDLDCLTVTGYLLPGRTVSAWNAVLMDDGLWYPVDLAASGGAVLLPAAGGFEAGHVAGLTPADGGTALDFPPLSDRAYDDDPWYTSAYVEWAVLVAIGAIIVAGILLAIRKEGGGTFKGK